MPDCGTWGLHRNEVVSSLLSQGCENTTRNPLKGQMRILNIKAHNQKNNHRWPPGKTDYGVSLKVKLVGSVQEAYFNVCLIVGAKHAIGCLYYT